VVTDKRPPTPVLGGAGGQRYERLSNAGPQHQQYNQKLETEKPAAGEGGEKLPYI
jgi:hypothetical protein